MRPPRFRSLRNAFIALAIICAATMFASPNTATARTDFLIPQVAGFSDAYPWFNNASQYQRDQIFQRYHQNPDWGAVKRHDWRGQRQDWETQSGQQNYSHQHAMIVLLILLGGSGRR